MDEPESERDQPASLELGSDDVLERHIHDGERDQRFDQRRKPKRVWRESDRRRHEGDRVRDGERRHDGDEWPNLPERDDEAEDEQEMVDAVEDVREAELDEAQRGLMPSRIETDQAGIA